MARDLNCALHGHMIRKSLPCLGRGRCDTIARCVWTCACVKEAGRRLSIHVSVTGKDVLRQRAPISVKVGQDSRFRDISQELCKQAKYMNIARMGHIRTRTNERYPIAQVNQPRLTTEARLMNAFRTTRNSGVAHVERLPHE